MTLALRALTAAAVLILSILHPWSPPGIASSPCGSATDLESATVECEGTTDNATHTIATSPPHFEYDVTPVCMEDRSLHSESCLRIQECRSAENGLMHHLWRRDTREPGASWTHLMEFCLGESEEVGAISTAVVEREFRALSWPASEVVIQPPGGTTLVNLETNFYTTNTEPTVQTIHLLGVRVDIEATPESYRWHFDRPGGDTGGSMSTSGPGAAYPDLEVTHTYREAPRIAHPSVDTVYRGRYRLDGGTWQEIPATVTVAGASVPLRISEAVGHLVDPGR